MGNKQKGDRHNWNINIEALDLPIISSVYAMHGKLSPRTTSFQVPYWVLNCGLIQNEIYFKVADYSNPWSLRRVANLHLYRPRTQIWEDFRDTPYAEFHGLALIFRMKETIDFKQKFLPEYDFFEFLDPESKVKLLIQEACRTVTEGKPGFLRAMKVQSILLEVIYMLLQSEQVEGNLYTVEHDEYRTDFTSRVNGYMREHLAEKLSVKKLAQYMHVSEAQMFKRYKKETGLSPMKQLTLMRVDKAKSLVMQGIPLDYTAVQTGFYDAFHLSKTFKKFEGFSPREYIKNLSGQH